MYGEHDWPVEGVFLLVTSQVGPLELKQPELVLDWQLTLHRPEEDHWQVCKELVHQIQPAATHWAEVLAVLGHKTEMISADEHS